MTKTKRKNVSHDIKKSISKHTVTMTKSMIKKYSSKKKTTLKRITDANIFVTQRIKKNQLEIQRFINSRKKKSRKEKIFNIITNPQLMESIFFLIKIVICAIILPLIIYIKDKPTQILNYENLYQFFIKQHSGTITKILLRSSIDHPVAISFLTEKFIYNPLGKILMKFSLFKGVIEVINNIKNERNRIDRITLDVLGRSLFNYDTFYAIKYCIESLTPKERNLDSLNKFKYISEASATAITIFDLILCGTKSSWCQSLKPIQKVTYVLPIFIDIGNAIYQTLIEMKETEFLGDPYLVAAAGLQNYCQKTFNLEDDPYENFVQSISSENEEDSHQSKKEINYSLENLEHRLSITQFNGKKDLKEEYMAKLKLYDLMSDPVKLFKMSKNNPKFKEEYFDLLIKSESQRLHYFSLFNRKLLKEFKKDAQELMNNLDNLEKIKIYSQEFKNQYKQKLDKIKSSLKKKSKKLRVKNLYKITGLGQKYLSKEEYRQNLWLKKAVDKLPSVSDVLKFPAKVAKQTAKVVDGVGDMIPGVNILTKPPANLTKLVADGYTNLVDYTPLPKNSDIIPKRKNVDNIDKEKQNINLVKEEISKIDKDSEDKKRQDEKNLREEEIRNKEKEFLERNEKKLALEKGSASSLIGLANSISNPTENNQDSLDLEKLYEMLNLPDLTLEQKEQIESLIKEKKSKIESDETHESGNDNAE